MQSYEQLADEGQRVLEKARRDDPPICLVDGNTSLAWHDLVRSLALTPQPVLRSPRRLAMVSVLGSQTILPRPLFRAAFAGLTRWSFQLAPGTLFDALGEDPR